MTIAKLKVKVNPKNPMQFDGLMSSYKTDIEAGHLCESSNDRQANIEYIFQEKKLMKAEDFDAAFLEYKEAAFVQ